MELSTLRILDASLNRAAEGLRVVDDYARFVLGDRHLSRLAKRLRHALAEASDRIDASDRHAARDTRGDVGTSVTAGGESERADAWHVCVASLKRVEQSLRSLEEFGKTLDARFASAVESLRYEVYTLEKSLDTTRSSRDRLGSARLCVLVDGRPTAEQFGQLARSLIEAGVDVLQLRDKTLDDRGLVGRARRLVEATRGTGCLAIVNDRPDIAAVAHADGVHVGQDELSVADARRIIGPHALVGVSTHSIDEARQAVLNGANYLGAGPTFPSQTKSFDTFPGLDYLREVSAEVTLPTFAIGGVNETNLPDVLSAGATRVAVAGAVAGANEPGAAARGLLEQLAAANR